MIRTVGTTLVYALAGLTCAGVPLYATAPEPTPSFAVRSAPQSGKAPDGRAGFGNAATVKTVRPLFQSPEKAQTEFLASLHALESELRLLVARFAKRYDQAGYFELIDTRSEATIESLHKAWFARRADPLSSLLEQRGRGEVFGRLAADVRFRVRARILVGLDDELRELNGSLNLMRAHFRGFADLQDHEAAQLGRRADIAASVLRAMRLDLDTLRADDPPDNAALEAFLGLARGGRGGAEGQAAVARAKAELARMDELEQRMLDALFSTRPSNELRTAVEWRVQQSMASERIAETVRMLSPVVTPENEAPPDVASMGKSKRHEYAARTAMEGLSYDLLNEELYYLAGESSDFQWGGLESRRWFDRYLALRGIRSYDHRSYDVKTLQPRERRALERVQAPIALPR